MPLVVDTYNVLHAVGVLPPDLAGIGVDGLLDLTARSRFARLGGVLVCDGNPRPGAGRRRHGALRVSYAGPGREADDVIEAIIARSTSPRRLVVVSSDGRIQRAARKRRCRILSAEAFLYRLTQDAAAEERPTPPARPSSALRDDEVDAWMDAFGVDDDELELLAAEAEAAVPDPEPEEPAPGAAATEAPAEEESPRRADRRRALEDAKTLDDIDLDELERLDMDEWI